MANITGNDVKSSDFLRVLVALKSNVMKNLHVAGIFRVTSSKSDMSNVTSYMCKSVDNADISVQAYCLSGIDVNENDYVLILMCDEDIRINYRKIKMTQQTQTIDSEQKHSLSYGIIIGKI